MQMSHYINAMFLRLYDSKGDDNMLEKGRNGIEMNIGEFLDKGYEIAESIDYSELHREIQIMTKLVKWFDEAIKTQDFYALYEKESFDGFNNYAIVMTNKSGMDLERFSAIVKPVKNGIELIPSKASISNWKSGEEGKILFYCTEEGITNLNMDAENISYSISDEVRFQIQLDEEDETYDEYDEYEEYEEFERVQEPQVPQQSSNNVIKCEVCGSAGLVKRDGLFECPACGTRYTLEEVKKLLH